MKYIYSLEKIPDSSLHFGGKAESLSRMIRAGLPVPPGCAIAAEAFLNGSIHPDAEKEFTECIGSLSDKYTYAVRSSAVGEDGKAFSFAGAYETVLDVKKENILEAVLTVITSVNSSRVSVYRENVESTAGGMGVVIERFIRPEYAGVLFTSDILSGSAAVMRGNYVRGVGESLVSGTVDAGSFSFDAIRYKYAGEKEFLPNAGKLYRKSVKIRKLFGCPQDIEWAVSRNKVFILQARPITTLCSHNEDRYDINDSLGGEYLLSKTNVGEIFMQPVSPATYSVLCSVFEILGIPLIANIYGQAYCNVSALCSILVSFGVSKKRAYSMISDLTGKLPPDVTIPVYPFDKAVLIRKMRILLFTPGKKANFGVSHTDFPNEISSIADRLIDGIHTSQEKAVLYSFWEDVCDAFMTKVMSAIMKGLSIRSLVGTRDKIRAIAGERLTNELCSNCSKDGILESMKPLFMIEDILSGKMTELEYMKRYGHRHANEMELACPYPYENPDFVGQVIDEYVRTGIKVSEMKSAQEKRYELAVEEFNRLYPAKAKWLDRSLRSFSDAVLRREDLRSQSVKLFCLMREFMLKAAELTGIGEDIFMLYFSEVMTLLKGDETVLKNIPLRRENYRRYLDMPAFPNIILGRFEPENWSSDPNRRSDYYKFGERSGQDRPSDIKGYAGAAGKVQGIARVLANVSEAELLLQGEILVTTATNIGWVCVFPKVSAIVTDIGAPLSHAAIVARELGIPAVVGCGNAAALLKTGDEIIVDGTNGSVYKVTVEEKAMTLPIILRS